MRYPRTPLLAMCVSALLALSVGCGDSEQDGEDENDQECATVVTFAFNPETGDCVQYNCDRPENVEGSYPSAEACREDNGSNPPGDAGMDTGADDAGPGDDGGTNPTDTDTPAPGDTDGADTSPPSDTSDGDPDTTSPGDAGHTDTAPTCQSQGKSECFSNLDCPSTHRCENIGSGDRELPCCVEGERGEKQAGETCSEDGGQLECESGVCIAGNSSNDYRCSTTCTEDADCPDDMQNCTGIIGTGGNKWCLPD